MANKFTRKPLDKTTPMPYHKVLTLTPIIVFFALTLWFWGNSFANYLTLLGLCVAEIVINMVNLFYRKKHGGQLDRTDVTLFVGGGLVAILAIYRLLTAS